MQRMSHWLRTPYRAYVYGINHLEALIQMGERRYTPLGRFTPGPFQGWHFLWAPGLLGFIASVMILAGCSFTNSPFKLNMDTTWFFGEPVQTPNGAPSETKLIFAIVLTYAGIILLMRVWLRLAEIVKLHEGASVRQLWLMLAVWATPMIIAPPLFSRDIFSYAAQGEMTSHHISPYLYGPFTMGSSPYVTPVDPLWGNAPAPYGPFFLFLDGSFAKLTHHNQLATVVCLRLLEVFAVGLIGWAVTAIARVLKRDPAEALVLGALNPLVILTLIAGGHNDAIMTGLLLVGVALALRKHYYWAFFFCALATAIKAPAALGIAFVAWSWVRDEHSPKRERLRPLIIGSLIGFITLSVTSWMAGFGFGWVRNLLSNGTVRSWAAPATGIGLSVTKLANGLGLRWSEDAVLTVTRSVGLAVAVGSSMWLLWHSTKRGWLRSLGVALVLFVMLGPVVQPWYLVWGLLVLAACYEGREHFWLLVLSIAGPFMGLPGAGELVTGFKHASIWLIVVAVGTLLTFLAAPMGSWTQWSWPEYRPIKKAPGKL
jgi:Glycosyltransferase family 87